MGQWGINLLNRTRGILRQQRPLQKRQPPWKRRYNEGQKKMHLQGPLPRSQRLPCLLEHSLLDEAGVPQVWMELGPIWTAVSTLSFETSQ